MSAFRRALLGFGRLFGRRIFYVVCKWDHEAHVWYVADSNVPGLATEAPTTDELLANVDALIPELLECNEVDEDDNDRAPLELVFKRDQELRLAGV